MRMRDRRWKRTVAAAALVAAAMFGVANFAADEDPSKVPKTAVHDNPAQRDPALELLRLRNEGVAHFESGIGLKKARDKFEAALKLKPESAIDLYNLGTTYRKLGDADPALDLLNRALRADPSLPHAYYTAALIHRTKGDNARVVQMLQQARERAPAEPSIYYQLGRVQREQGKNPEALQSFLHALQLDPYLGGALYQLYLYYQEQGDKDLAQRTFEEFSRVKRAAARTRKELNEDESVLARPIGDADKRARTQAQEFQPVFAVERLALKEAVAAFDVNDINDDGKEDLLLATRDGKLKWIENRDGFASAAAYEVDIASLGAVRALKSESFARNEAPRAVLVTETGVYLSGPLKGPAVAPKRLSVKTAATVTLVDIDHDGDIDIVVGALATVLLNQGNAGFTEQTRYLPPNVATGVKGFDQAPLTADLLNQSGVDFVLTDASGQRRLLKDALGGNYAPSAAAALAPRPGLRWQGSADFDNDGRIDVVTLTAQDLAVDFNLGRYRFEPVPLAAAGAAARVAIGDFNNDGRADLIAVAPGGAPLLWVNRGQRQFDKQPFGTAPPAAVIDLRVLDADGDGRQDAIGLLENGEVYLWRNRSAGVGRSMQVALRGLRSVPSGQQAHVEVRRGDFYAKYEAGGRPLHVALGAGDYAEVLRIVWANGFVESKFNVEGGKRWVFKESERVSGSCPSVFAWDGRRFQFVTDAFISGPMGVPMGPGKYFPVDHDEYIKISGEQLRADGGVLRLAITEELREAVYLDQARLYAIDRPASVEVYPNEYLAPGDFPAFKLHLTANAKAPPAAFDHRGRDVLDLIAHADRRYPANLTRLPYAGFVEPQGVEIVLPPGAARSPHLRLFLTGWFYYFESTSLLAAAQRTDLPLIWPQLQVQRDGKWEKLTDIGIPPGKDKTVVIDLGGKLPPDTQRVRLWTNFELYWDRILVDTSAPPAQATARFVEIPMQGARLRFHGFSALVHAQGTFPQPERFDYHRVQYRAMWNPLRGKYTRYGEVQPLLVSADSQMAVFGSGDEVALEFDSRGLAPLAPGWRRDFMLYLNGYVKDGDRHTAHAGAVEPMPFAGMQSYPLAEADARAAPYASPLYRDYLARFQTRDPLRFTGPELAGAPVMP